MSRPPDSPDAERWVTVSGLLHADMRVILAPLFPAERPRRTASIRQGSPHTLTVEFLDRRGNRLCSAVVPTEPLCEQDVGTLASASPEVFSTPVVLPPETGSIKVLSPIGQELTSVAASEHNPELELEWELPQEEAQGVVILAWRASHPDEVPLSFLVTYSHDGWRWQALSLPGPSRSIAIDFDELPGGDQCRLRVVASDGINLSVKETEPFRVALKGQVPLIVSVEPSPPVPTTEPLVLYGQAFDLERNTVVTEGLRWTSSRDGELGSGGVLTTRLSPGLHRIRLEVIDQGHRAVADNRDRATSMELQVVPSYIEREAD